MPFPGSKQLREYRIARRAGVAVSEAAAAVGFSQEEARLWEIADAADPPGPECYVELGKPVQTPRFEVLTGDCRDLMAAMPDCSVDAIVCDPPYELGFMGKAWDATGIAYDRTVWEEALRVLKPGGHLLAFSGSRTYHRMVVAIEDAGFEIRDQLMWIYGSGFPKSLDVSKAIDKAAGAEREVIGSYEVTRDLSGGSWSELHGKPNGATSISITSPATPEAARWSGWGTALKPAHEPIVMARKPLIGTVAANVLEWGVGGINVDGCRVPTNGETPRGSGNDLGYHGGGQGTGGNSTPAAGRFPANVLHDGSDEVVAMFPETKSGALNQKSVRAESNGYGFAGYADPREYAQDSGSAARFFYSAKASRDDRSHGLADGNHHPTVKPTDVMRWLVRMITPPGGIVLDPFTGSGSTGRAAMMEGMRFVGCELSEEYAVIARARIAAALEIEKVPESKRARAMRKSKVDERQCAMF